MRKRKSVENCIHGVRPWNCKDCTGIRLCEHNRQTHCCTHCGSKGIFNLTATERRRIIAHQPSKFTSQYVLSQEAPLSVVELETVVSIQSQPWVNGVEPVVVEEPLLVTNMVVGSMNLKPVFIPPLVRQSKISRKTPVREPIFGSIPQFPATPSFEWLQFFA